MKSGAPFFHMDILYTIYLDVKYFSVVCLGIYYKKLSVQTTLTTMRHFFVKNLNLSSSGKLEVDGCPSKKDLFRQSVLLLNPTYIAFPKGDL